MNRILLTLGLLAAFCLPLKADDKPKEKKPTADALLSAGLSQAKQENKRVFLVFGSPACPWCKVFDKFHDDRKVASVLAKYMVLVKVDVVRNPGGSELYKKYESGDGVPTWSILDADAKVMGNSKGAKGNVGYPYESHEIDHYVKVFKKACPSLTDKEIALLSGKLKEMYPKKK